ncbi:hypothetical protein ACFLFF_09750 [Brevibacillus reuszeri]|uniref:hypothetical protein n=1 Tax=Brevibacillus reuszeri TaxID=54915 RepID=UPI003672006C
MKKKQLALSVMSTALVASMAASAFAAPKAGVYIGGNVDKYYSFEAMGLNMDKFLDEMIDTVPDVLYVSKDGEAKGGNLAELLFVSNPKSHFVDVTDEMFADIDGADGFYRVNEDGTVGTVKEKPDGTVTPGELKVESVSAITDKSVTIKFATAPAADPLASSFSVKDSNGNTYSVTTVAKSQEAGVYVLTLGTSITGKGTLTVKASATDTGATKDFDFTTLGITLSVEAAETQLVSDGADNTILTVKVLKNGELDTNFKGTVKFTSLKGAKFAKEVVAFDKGIATVQITSISSATAIQDTIIAAIADAEDPAAVGKTFNLNLDYLPTGVGGEIGEKVFATYAESDRASDVWVQFNKPFNFEKLYADWKANPGSLKVNGNPVTDVVQVNDKTLKLVLLDPNTGASGVLPDNSTINVETVYTGPGGVFVESKVPFILVDPQAPAAVAASAPDYRTIVAQFTEPVAKENAQVVTNWVLNGKQLSSSDVVEVKVGRAVTSPTDIKDYVQATHTDNRHYVTIRLTANGAKKLKAAGSQNLLQAYNITDFAGYTDITGQNKAATQEFRFVTPDVPNAPTATVSMDSVEQFRVKFSSPVSKLNGADLTASNFKFEMQNGKNADGSAKFVEVDLEDVVSDPTKAVVHKISDSEYLIELEQDWTVKYNTQGTGRNYYTPDWNNVRITVFADDVKNDLDVKMSENRVETLRMVLDATNPTIVKAEQSKDPVTNALTKAVDVLMSEPVQLNLPNGTKEITESQQQQATLGVPVPTFEFVNEDESVTLEGQLSTVPAPSEDDMSFTVEPKDPSKLTPGKWKLYIRSISDDVGNTSGTVVADIEIKGVVAGKAEPRIIWATAHDNVDLDQLGTSAGKADADIVHIQFGTEMSLDALTSVVYTINGKDIPEGSNIISVDNAKYDIDGNGTYDFTGTLVTIKLPKDFLGKTSEEVVDTYFTTTQKNHVLNVSKSLTDADGKLIQTPREVELSFSFTGVASHLTSHTLAYDNAVYDGTTGAINNGVIEGDLHVTGENITLNNVTINGDLIIDADVQDDFTMNNVTVNGTVIVNGGDSTSVHLLGSRINGDVEANKVDVHVDLTGTTVTGKVKINATGVKVDGNGTYDVVTDPKVIKADAIKAANDAIALVPVVKDITVDTLADAKAKVAAAEKAIADAKAVDAVDADFKGLARLTAAKDKIKELDTTPVVVDKATLTTKVNEAKALKEADYTPASWTAADLATVIPAAEAVLNKADATQADVDAQVKAINDAVGKLVEKTPVVVDKATLTTKIDEAKALKEADYTAASWTDADLATVIPAAEAVLNKADATQADVDAQVKAINDAVGKLVEKTPVVVDKATLTTKIDEAKALKEADFTTASWTEADLATVIPAAEAVLNKADATQADVDAQVKAINDAVGKLVTV